MEETPHTGIGADEALLRLSLVAGGEGPEPSLVARLARANAHVDLPLTFAYLAAADQVPHRACASLTALSKAQGPTQCVQDDAAGELFEDMANRARDGDWGAMRAEEEKWRLAGCYYFALRCLIYLLYAVPSLTLVRHLTLSWPMVRAMPSYFRYWCPYACAGGCGPEFVP